MPFVGDALIFLIKHEAIATASVSLFDKRTRESISLPVKPIATVFQITKLAHYWQTTSSYLAKLEQDSPDAL